MTACVHVPGCQLLLFVLQHLSDAQLCTPVDLAYWKEEARGHAATCGQLSVTHVGNARHRMCCV